LSRIVKSPGHVLIWPFFAGSTSPLRLCVKQKSISRKDVKKDARRIDKSDITKLARFKPLPAEDVIMFGPNNKTLATIKCRDALRKKTSVRHRP
jgi:hypothetical protein